MSTASPLKLKEKSIIKSPMKKKTKLNFNEIHETYSQDESPNVP